MRRLDRFDKQAAANPAGGKPQPPYALRAGAQYLSKHRQRGDGQLPERRQITRTKFRLSGGNALILNDRDRWVGPGQRPVVARVNQFSRDRQR